MIENLIKSKLKFLRKVSTLLTLLESSQRVGFYGHNNYVNFLDLRCCRYKILSNIL